MTRALFLLFSNIACWQPHGYEDFAGAVQTTDINLPIYAVGRMSFLPHNSERLI